MDASRTAANSEGDLKIARRVKDVTSVHSTLWPEQPQQGSGKLAPLSIYSEKTIVAMPSPSASPLELTRMPNRSMLLTILTCKPGDGGTHPGKAFFCTACVCSSVIIQTITTGFLQPSTKGWMTQLLPGSVVLPPITAPPPSRNAQHH